MAKWVLEFFKFDLAFCLRPGTGMCRFCDRMHYPKGKSEGDDSWLEDPESQWAMHVDGVSNVNGLRAGLILTSPEMEDIQYALHFGFLSTNNEAEYEALIIVLTIAKELGVQYLKAYSDSQLVVGNVLNEYEGRRA